MHYNIISIRNKKNSGSQLYLRMGVLVITLFSAYELYATEVFLKTYSLIDTVYSPLPWKTEDCYFEWDGSEDTFLYSFIPSELQAALSLSALRAAPYIISIIEVATIEAKIDYPGMLDPWPVLEKKLKDKALKLGCNLVVVQPKDLVYERTDMISTVSARVYRIQDWEGEAISYSLYSIIELGRRKPIFRESVLSIAHSVAFDKVINCAFNEFLKLRFSGAVEEFKLENKKDSLSESETAFLADSVRKVLSEIYPNEYAEYKKLWEEVHEIGKKLDEMDKRDEKPKKYKKSKR